MGDRKGKKRITFYVAPRRSRRYNSIGIFEHYCGLNFFVRFVMNHDESSSIIVSSFFISISLSRILDLFIRMI